MPYPLRHILLRGFRENELIFSKSDSLFKRPKVRTKAKVLGRKLSLRYKEWCGLDKLFFFGDSSGR